MSRWSFSVEQDGMVVASGDAPTEDGAKREAGHYAMMYAQDGPVKVSLRERVRGTPTLPREGKAQEFIYDAAGTRVAQNGEFIYGRSGIAPDFNEVHIPVQRRPLPDLDGELEEGCLMYGGGEDGLCHESSNCPGCAQNRRLWRKKFAEGMAAVREVMNTPVPLKEFNRIEVDTFLAERMGAAIKQLDQEIVADFGAAMRAAFEGSPSRTYDGILRIEESKHGVEVGGAAGEDRRTVEAVSKGDDGVESGAVGVGEKKGVDG